MNRLTEGLCDKLDQILAELEATKAQNQTLQDKIAALEELCPTAKVAAKREEYQKLREELNAILGAKEQARLDVIAKKEAAAEKRRKEAEEAAAAEAAAEKARLEELENNKDSKDD